MTWAMPLLQHCQVACDHWTRSQHRVQSLIGSCIVVFELNATGLSGRSLRSQLHINMS